jgi:CheY-like chemotaxis protein
VRRDGSVRWVSVRSQTFTRMRARFADRYARSERLVEDEPMILQLTKSVLERLGYSVLPVGLPSEAMRITEEHPGTIDLFLTDVTMPEMNGRDLAKRLVARSPQLKCLFMSGYAADGDLLREVIEQRANFLQKPLTPQDLGAIIRRILDA